MNFCLERPQGLMTVMTACAASLADKIITSYHSTFWRYQTLVGELFSHLSRLTHPSCLLRGRLTRRTTAYVSRKLIVNLRPEPTLGDTFGPNLSKSMLMHNRLAREKR